MHRDHSHLREITLQLTDVDRPLWSLGVETTALYEFLEARATFSIDSDQDITEGETRSERGLAISPTQAAMCAWEVARTAAFIRGAAQAVQDKSDSIKSTGRPVQVLYAGCGPFALLAVPLMALFPPDQVQFVLLDIHEESIASARGIVESLEFTKHVADYACGDACQYELAAHLEPDIIISETMNVCLNNEPLVMIACHLLGQSADAILVPQSVRVDACLVAQGKEFVFNEPDHPDDVPVPDRDRVLLGTVFELNGDNARHWGSSPRDQLPASSVTIASPLEERYSPMLLTTVAVYGDVVLKDYDCSLTMPTPIRAGQELRGGEELRFEYRLGRDPELVCTVAPVK